MNSILNYIPELFNISEYLISSLAQILLSYSKNGRENIMIKTRIKMDHNCFEGNYYVVQKRVFFFFWMDASDWMKELSKAEELKKYMDSGLFAI